MKAYKEMSRQELLEALKEKGLDKGLHRASKEALTVVAEEKLGQPKVKKAVAKKKVFIKKVKRNKAISHNHHGVIEHWIALFSSNELKAQQKKAKDILTDEQITEAMKAAFPDRPSKVFEQVALVRGRYNRGALSRRIETPVEKCVSHRYWRNEDGDGSVWVCSNRGKATKEVK